VRRGERHAVVGADHLWQPKFLEGALEHREGESLLGGRERFARQQVAAGEIGDRQRIAVLPVAEHELALIVGAPEHVGLDRPRERGARGDVAPPPAAMHQAVAIEDRMHGADRRQVRPARLPPQLFADLRRAPARILALQVDDHRFQLRRQAIGLTMGPPAAIAEALQAAVLVAGEDFVAGLA
jgi:hypothetical protein